MTSVLQHQQPTDRSVCWAFLRGECNRGQSCRYSHQPINQPGWPAPDPRPRPRPQSDSHQPRSRPRQDTPCRFFLQGNCYKGNSCRFLHALPANQQAGPSATTTTTRNNRQGEPRDIINRQDVPRNTNNRQDSSRNATNRQGEPRNMTNTNNRQDSLWNTTNTNNRQDSPRNTTNTNSRQDSLWNTTNTNNRQDSPRNTNSRQDSSWNTINTNRQDEPRNTPTRYRDSQWNVNTENTTRPFTVDTQSKYLIPHLTNDRYLPPHLRNNEYPPSNTSAIAMVYTENTTQFWKSHSPSLETNTATSSTAAPTLKRRSTPSEANITAATTPRIQIPTKAPLTTMEANTVASTVTTGKSKEVAASTEGRKVSKPKIHSAIAIPIPIPAAIPSSSNSNSSLSSTSTISSLGSNSSNSSLGSTLSKSKEVKPNTWQTVAIPVTSAVANLPLSKAEGLSYLEENEQAVRQLSLQRPRPTHKCLICFDDFQNADECKAQVESGSAELLGLVLSCGHEFCTDCLGEALKIKLKEPSLQFPIACPQHKCTSAVSNIAAERVLGKKEMETWWEKKLESDLKETTINCPHGGCGAPLIRDPDVMCQDVPVECMECHRGFCGNCVVTWHTNMTCKQYQSLPLNQRNPDELALRNLASTMGWHRCPKCRVLIDKSQGCNHMTCKCGSQFCYRCGNLWANNKCTVDCHYWNDQKLKDERARLETKYASKDAKTTTHAETSAASNASNIAIRFRAIQEPRVQAAREAARVQAAREAARVQAARVQAAREAIEEDARVQAIIEAANAARWEQERERRAAQVNSASSCVVS